MVDGDVRITARFVQAGDGVGGEGYALSFDKDAQIPEAYGCEVILNGELCVGSYNDTDAYRNSTDEYNVPIVGIRNLNVEVINGLGKELKNVYMYIDLNNDGKFVALLNENGLPAMSSELVAFSCHNGVDSKGNPAQKSASVTLPAFVFDEAIPDGMYRMRLKLDTDNINPDGSETIVADNGLVFDYLINLVGNTKKLTLYTENGSIDGVDNTALPLTVDVHKMFTVVLRGAPGYECSKLVARHGHNLDGAQYVNGNRQWSEEVLSVNAYNKENVDASFVDGDVALYATFEPEEGSEWQLVFSDEFNADDYSQPVDEKWMRCQRYGSTWNRWLSDSKEVVYLQGGDLVTRAIPNPDQESDPVPMITGGIKSNGRFGFTYGYVEARILSNPWIGHFPAFWMMPEDQSAGWPDCGEIDIWEAIDTDGRSYHTVHSNWTYDLGNKNNPKSSFNVGVSYDRYHTYGLEWNEKTLIWYVDGKEVGRYNKSANASQLNQGQWPYDKHFHLILNQSVGNGSWAKDADVNHTYETRFDWVRVYQRKGMKNTDGTVGIAAVSDRNDVAVRCVDGGVVISAENDIEVSVYDVTGRKVAAANVCDSAFVPLERGVYLVAGKKVVVL